MRSGFTNGMPFITSSDFCPNYIYAQLAVLLYPLNRYPTNLCHLNTEDELKRHLNICHNFHIPVRVLLPPACRYDKAMPFSTLMQKTPWYGLDPASFPTESHPIPLALYSPHPTSLVCIPTDPMIPSIEAFWWTKGNHSFLFQQQKILSRITQAT